MLGNRSLCCRTASGTYEILAHDRPRFRIQRPALQTFDHMRLVQTIGRIQVVRLGAYRMHTGALHLLDDKSGQGAPKGRFGSLVHACQHCGGKSQALLVREIGAVRIGTGLLGVIKILGVDQNYLLETVALPVSNHFRVGKARHHRVMFLAVPVPDQCRQEVGHLGTVSYTHLRAHETRHELVCRLLLEKKKKTKNPISAPEKQELVKKSKPSIKLSQ